MSGRYLALAISSLLLLGLAGCSEDGTPSADDVARFCDAACGKFDTCGTLMGFLTRDECVSRCVSPSDDGEGVEGPTCEVSNSQIDSCLSALDAASCTSINEGELPSACDVCPEDDPGGADAGMSMVSTECAALQICCNALTSTDKASCEAVVNMNRGAVCSASEPLYCAAPDAGAGDAGAQDVGPMDSGAEDAGPADTGSADAGGGVDGGGSGCEGLMQCCGQLSPELQPSCLAVVGFENEPACDMALESLRSEGLCD